MFRFIALAWQASAPEQADAAAWLALGLERHGRWRPVLRRPGLHVYVAGAAPGVNGAHAFPARRGVVIGKLFRRRDLTASAGGSIALSDDDADNVLASGGRALVQEYWGRYVAFLATPPGATTIIRDPSGTLPCYLTRHLDVWVAFSWLEDVLTDLPGAPRPGINWDGLAGHILVGELGGHETAIEGVRQLVAGEAVEVGAGTSTTRPLWSAVERARVPLEPAPDSAAEQLRCTVRACAQSWARSYDRILLRLSGGVDSSILLSCLARGRTHAEVVCVNYHSPGSDSDERHYARLAAARAERELVERVRDERFGLGAVLEVCRTPAPGNYVGRMSARLDHELATIHGAQAMFTGAGGDQLFYEFARCWPAADYLRCRGADAGWLSVAMAAARLGGVSLWKTLATAVRERMRPTLPWLDVQANQPLIGPAAISMAGQRNRFVHPDLLSLDRLPIGKAVQVQALLHPAPYYDPFHPDSALESVHPLLSQPLVELCLQLPTWLLTHGGRGRALARIAFARDLPSEIARRRTKGGMEEHIKSVLARDIALARSLLLDGELVRRGLLDRRRVEEALSDKPSTLPATIGRIHVYIGIEAWLGRWR